MTILNTKNIFTTHVMSADLKLGLYSGQTVETVYDSTVDALVPVSFTRFRGDVYLDQQPHGQVYVKYEEL